MVKWNLSKVKLVTGNSTGTPVRPVLLEMIRAAAAEIAIESCVTMAIQVKDLSDVVQNAYPLTVHDIAQNALTVANDEAEYMTIWNANATNRTRGLILSGVGTTFDVRPVYINIVPPLYGVP